MVSTRAIGHITSTLNSVKVACWVWDEALPIQTDHLSPFVKIAQDNKCNLQWLSVVLQMLLDDSYAVSTTNVWWGINN